MSQFDFWQQWGAQLDDAQFANAWAALGVVRNRGVDSPRAALERRFDIPPGYRVPWRFPLGDKSAELVAGTTPLEWANAWRDAAAGSEPRLSVIAMPPGEPVMPWLRLLSETSPLTAAVSVDLPVWPIRTIEFPTPLRLGYLPGNDAQPIVAGLPCAGIELGPGSVDCDILVFVGTAVGFEKAAQPVKGRAAFALLFDANGADPGTGVGGLEHRLRCLDASGYAYSRAPLSAHDISDALTRLLEALEQDKFFDAAVAASFAGIDLFAAFTTSLAGHRLSQAFEWVGGAPADPVPRDSGPKIHAPTAAPQTAPPAPGGGILSAPRRPGVSPPAPKDTTARPPMTTQAPSGPATRSTGQGAGPRVEPPRPKMAAKPTEAAAGHEEPAARFLRQESFAWHQGVKKKAENGFIAGQKALVRVSIGSKDENLDTFPAPFPVKDLPQDVDEWLLDVWLTEPDHLDEPLRGEIKLPREGNSNTADFEFTPRPSNPAFEGRISVLHRGRVIQTAVLRASVQPDAPELKTGRKPKLEDRVHVRHAIGDLKNRRPFDLAFVLNHTELGQPRAVALADKRAWIANIAAAKVIAGNISDKLAQITRSVPDYADGIKGKKGLALLVDLAREGTVLRRHMLRDLNAAGNQSAIADETYVQVVSVTTDAVIPFEFIYDFEAPEVGAKLCAKWSTGIDKGKVPEECRQHTSKEVCPMGFWGLRKVIERHQLSPQFKPAGWDMYLQSEPSEARSVLELDGVSVFGTSNNVSKDAVKSLTTAIKSATGQKAYQAKNWADWIDGVKQSRPKLLIALAHSDGARANSGMELGGEFLADIDVKPVHVLFAKGDPSPLVALLGCDTVGTGNEIYGNYASTFRDAGAAIVIGTIATVLAAHAPKVAESLVAGLLAGDANAPQRVGEVLRNIKRQALVDKQIMPLCLVAYGDADWQIKRN